MNIQNKLIGLIGHAVLGTAAPKVAPEDMQELYSLAEAHDLTHLLACGLEGCDALAASELREKLTKKKFTAVMRHRLIATELDSLCELLEEKEIDHLPLKGAIMRHYYPEPWMRTSCDVDILVKPDDLDSAIALICDKLEYEYRETGDHNATLYSPGGVCLELHYKLIRSDFVDVAERPLVNLWERLSPEPGFHHKYVMPDELFYYYHVAHIAKHYTYGGTGIRSVLDTYILAARGVPDKSALDALLKDGGLYEFNKNLCHLAKAWFGGGEECDLDREMGAYISRSGVYGRIDHSVALRQADRGSRFKYILSRIWIPYVVYKKDHPLWRFKALRYPFWQIGRWLKLIFSREVRRRSAGELKMGASISSNTATALSRHMANVGLAEIPIATEEK